ncbi:hypothetical protein ACQEVZ_20320 [Dactylosporangium sp. CA-152071]|uniref:hypothetical protein n=1 Tax=Dactylosporangium sp. CA-152071 TaxID=3239933 RepID=UPI003D8ECFB7
MNYTAPILINGGVYPAEMWQEGLDEVEELSASAASAWTAYGTDTTIITATPTSPTKGNSTWTAQYRFVAPKQVQVRIRYDIGSTFSAGSGIYNFLLPFAASVNGLAMDLGIAMVNDQGSAYRNCRVFLFDTTHAQVVRDDQGAPIGNGGPGTAWATTDIIRVNLTYEIA